MTDRTQSNPVLIGATLSCGLFAFFIYIGLIATLLVELSEDFGTAVAVMRQLTTITGASWVVLAPSWHQLIKSACLRELLCLVESAPLHLGPELRLISELQT